MRSGSMSYVGRQRTKAAPCALTCRSRQARLGQRVRRPLWRRTPVEAASSTTSSGKRVPTMNPIRRIQKEINDIRNDKESGLTIDVPDADDIRHLKASFPGPEGSPYQGGRFKVDVEVVEGYPFQPLKMKFITKVYHPNISSASGAICLDILTSKAWTPVLTLRSTLVSLRSLLCSPEPDDPQDAEVAAHYKADKKGFEETAKFWTECYAKEDKEGADAGAAAPPTGASKQDAIQRAGLRAQDVDKFTAMGFEQDKVIEVLSRRNYRGANVQSISDDDILTSLLQ